MCSGRSLGSAAVRSGPAKASSARCTAPSGGYCAWSGPLAVGTGTTPSIALLKNTVYAVWSENESIKMSIFPFGVSNAPVPTTISPAVTPAIERNRMPAITAWWNGAAAKPIVDVYWYYNRFQASSWFPTTLWILKRHSLGANGVWTQSNRKLGGLSGSGIPSNVNALATSINDATGAVTIGLSVDDYTAGPKTWLLNDTAETVVYPLGAWITLDSFQGCGLTGVRIAVAPMNGSASYRQVYNRNTLASTSSAVTLATGAFTPVASTWSRYSGSGMAASNYRTDYVESIQGVPYLGLYNLVADSQSVTGFQAAQLCQQIAYF